MLIAEAQWIRKVLDHMKGEDVSPLLDIGSATASFREQVQPWINGEIFVPLQKRGVVVHHLDMQDGDGIDVYGDLADDRFLAGLATRGYRILLCCNVLEHVTNPAAICATLEQVVPPGGHLVVTVPYRFPYHPDPIDTMFRPDVGELARLFPHCRLVSGDIIDAGSGWDYVDRDPRVLAAKVKRRLSGLKEHGGGKGVISFLPWLFRRFRVNCSLFQKHN